MTNIVDFIPRAESAAVNRINKAPAEIIIFPGVRYERMESGNVVAGKREAASRTRPALPALLQG